MSTTAFSGSSGTTVTRSSVATVAAERLANTLLRWADRHSRVAQPTHEEMALTIANDRVLAVVREGRRW